MRKLDATFIEECGLGDLPTERKNQFLQWFYAELEMRVGRRIAALLTDAQIDDFERVLGETDHVQALTWLTENVPDHQAIALAEFGQLEWEARARSEALIEAARIPAASLDPG